MGSVPSKNWAWKTRNLLDDIRNFRGLLLFDEPWETLAQQKLNQRRNTVMSIPQDSDKGGRLRYQTYDTHIDTTENF